MKRASLADMAAKKPADVRAEAVTPASPARSGAQVDGRKGVLVRLKPEGWRALRDVAAELTVATGDQVTMQSLMVDAVNELLKKNGRSPLA